MVEVGGLSFKEGLRIYASVYMVRNKNYYCLDNDFPFACSSEHSAIETVPLL